MFRSPGADRLAAALRTARDRGALVSLDPNIRPGLVGAPAEARARVDGLVALAHVVKASEEDIAWLYPGRSAEDVLRHWQELGARLAVVTLGAEGALAVSGTSGFRQPAPVVDVVDTIGAGDAFTAGLLAGLSRSPAGRPDEDRPGSRLARRGRRRRTAVRGRGRRRHLHPRGRRPALPARPAGLSRYRHDLPG